MKKGALNSTSPRALRGGFVQVDDYGVQGIARVYLHIGRAVEPLIGSGIAETRATGERARLLDHEPNDARFARVGKRNCQ
jgi:hypothetical protein